MPYYAAMTTAGSLLGCFLLYVVARKGGEVFLRKRFSAAKVDRGMALYQRWGLLAVVVPSLLPPLTHDEAVRLQRAWPVGPVPRPSTEPVTVQRRASNTGVIMVASNSTGVEISTNGKAGCMIDSTGWALASGLRQSSS